jgi:hypothetical protein
MTTKALQKQHTNETILQSAARLLREKGISGARRTGVTSRAKPEPSFRAARRLARSIHHDGERDQAA